MTLRNVMLSAGVGLAVVAVLLYAYYPVAPHSILSWAALVGLGIPVWVGLEWLGEQVGELQLFKRRSSGVRILLAVPVVLALIALGWLGTWLVQWAVLAAGCSGANLEVCAAVVVRLGLFDTCPRVEMTQRTSPA